MSVVGSYVCTVGYAVGPVGSQAPNTISLLLGGGRSTVTGCPDEGIGAAGENLSATGSYSSVFALSVLQNSPPPSSALPVESSTRYP